MLSRIGREASWPMRIVETFPQSICIFICHCMVERKIAEFYYNMDRRLYLVFGVWLRWLIFITFFQTIAGVLGWVKRWPEPNVDFSPLNINVSECQMKHPFVFPEMRIRWIFLSSSGSNIHIKCKLEEVWITLCIQIGRRRNLSWEGHPNWIQKTTNDQSTKKTGNPQQPFTNLDLVKEREVEVSTDISSLIKGKDEMYS